MLKESVKEFLIRFKFYFFSSSILIVICCVLGTYSAPVKVSLVFIGLLWLLGTFTGVLTAYIVDIYTDYQLKRKEDK